VTFISILAGGLAIVLNLTGSKTGSIVITTMIAATLGGLNRIMEEKILIFLMAGVTALPRLLPMWFFSGRTFSPFLTAWLKFVPVAVLAAMVGPELFLKKGELYLSVSNLYLWAALPTLVVGFWKKNLVLTVVTGIVALALLRLFLA